MTNEAVNNDIQASEQLSQLPAEAVRLSAVTSSISLNSGSTKDLSPSVQPEPTPPENNPSPLEDEEN